MPRSKTIPAIRLGLACCLAACLQGVSWSVFARADYAAWGALTVTVQSAPGVEVTAYGREDDSDSVSTGSASATVTPFFDPAQPTLLGQGETLTVRSTVEGLAVDGEASSFLFSEAVVELFNPTASPVTVELAYSYEVQASATVEVPAAEDAVASAQIDVADDSGAVSELWIASADGRTGPFESSMQGDGVWSITVDPGAASSVNISGLVDSQGGAVGVGSTHAVISDFRASAHDEGLLLEWETAAELRTLGFQLERRGLGDRGYHRVNDDLLLGLMGAPNGGFYSYVDSSAQPGRRYQYRLVEVETNGREQVYGPYVIRVRAPRTRRGGTAPAAAARMAPAAAAFSDGDAVDGRTASAATVPDPGVPGYRRRPKPPTGGPRAKDVEAETAIDLDQPSLLQRSLVEPATLQAQPMALSEPLDAPASEPQTVIKVLVDETGVYEITAAALASALNQPLGHVQDELRNRRLRLTRYALVAAGEPRVEQEVAWERLRRGAGLRFFGQALGELEPDNLYSDQNVYWLEFGVPGTTMRSVMGIAPRDAADAGEVYQESVTWQVNRSPLPFNSDDPDRDFWLWKPAYKTASSGFNALIPDADFGDPLLLTPDAAATGTATLRVSLMGGSAANLLGPDHQFVMTLNGVQVGGGGPWDGLDWFEAEIEVDQSLLQAGGTNVVEVGALLPAGAPYSAVWVDKLELTFWRHYTAMDDSAVVPAGDAPVVSVRGFGCPAGDMMAYDITDPLAPRYYRTGLLKLDETGAVSFKPAGGSEHLTLCAGALKTPELAAASSAEWLATGNDYDYVLLAPQELADGAAVHAIYRASPAGGGYSTAVFTLDELYDNCNGGIVDASAIRDCLRHAYDHWAGVPAYVLFVGEGTIDPKDYLGLDENRFPVRECYTPYGLYTCDNWFADFYDPDGTPAPDGLSELLLGRAPVSTNAEMVAFSDKVAAYESDAYTGSGNLLWTADNPDGAGSFHTDSDQAAALAVGYSIDKIYFSSGDNATTTRNSIKAALDAGPEMFHWVGHGAPGVLADEQLFRLVDAQAATNTRTTLFTALTCTVGYGAYPETESIVEALVVRPNNATSGAVSAFAPTGESLNYLARSMDQVFIDALYGLGAATTLGEAAWLAIEAAPSDPSLRFMRDIYHVFGDPALVPWRL